MQPIPANWSIMWTEQFLKSGTAGHDKHINHIDQHITNFPDAGRDAYIQCTLVNNDLTSLPIPAVATIVITNSLAPVSSGP